MKKKRIIKVCLLAILMSINFSCNKEKATKLSYSKIDSKHPNLILTVPGVQKVKSNIGKLPILDTSIKTMKAEVDKEISKGIDVPIPRDFSGGYTHERHKRNFFMLQKAGLLYQILDKEKYGIYVRNMLMEYAKIYQTLPLHPQKRSYARGKLFWQCLNDSNWLVYVSQAYDNVYNFLKKEERQTLENKLFRPMADFLSKGNPQFFNRVHNHSTWGNAAVGMIALVMNDNELLNRALYGLKDDGISSNMKDNDGGFIKTKGQKTGFYANLDEPFSPDGYYTEGPYYQRYAMYPFLIFAQALQNKRPDIKIFEYKDGVLTKSVEALLNLTDKNGEFFTLNDAQKGMSYYSRELLTAVNIAYHFGGNNPQLLSIAKKQKKVTLDDAGLSVAIGIKKGKAKPFEKKSIELRDGANGKQGGLAVLRQSGMELVFKYTAQGLSHGHYDKLSFLLNENGKEVIQDYGMVRFVNIEQKGGGNYLKENKTWAKQTIGHNTITQNRKSHFNAKYDIGSKHHSERYLFNVSNPNLQAVSAKESNAYQNTEMHRTLAFINIENIEKPLLLDIFKVNSKNKNNYDLPYYYLGQLMQTNLKYNLPKKMESIGTKNGYQHLYKEANGRVSDDNLKFSWLSNDTFYTLTSDISKNDKVVLARIGANDPDFNLRRDPALILQKENKSKATFVSSIESHGNYSPVREIAVNAYSSIASLKVRLDNDKYTVVEIKTVTKKAYLFFLSNKNNSPKQTHQLNIGKVKYNWQGPFFFKSID